MIAQLQHDHDRLRDLADRLDVYLGNAVPPTAAEFAQLRWTMVRQLSMHLAVERTALARWRACAGKRSGSIDLALDDAFARHIAKWTGATLSTRWDEYRKSTRALLVRLRQRMDFEEATMFPDLAGDRAR